jgi:hypothetical protein
MSLIEKVEAAHGTECQWHNQSLDGRTWPCAFPGKAIHHWHGKDLCTYHSPFDSNKPTYVREA